MEGTILWTQAPTSTEKDILLVNGKECDETKRERYFRFLFDNRKPEGWRNVIFKRKHIWTILCDNFSEKRDEEGSMSSQLTCYTDKDNKILINSVFNETDEIGRKLCFSFSSDTSDMKDAICRLQEISTSIKRTWNDRECDFLLRLENSLKKKRRNRIVILVLIFIISFAVWKLMN